MKEGKILIETAEKVNYISEYIVAYKAKIEALNKRGYLIQQLYMKFLHRRFANCGLDRNS